MNEEAPQGEPPPPEDGLENGFVALFTRLIDDGEEFVRAEMQLYRAQLLARLKEGRSAVIMVIVAFFLAQSALVALLVGLVATLRRPLGPAGATAVVVLGALLVAGALAWLGIDKLRRATEIKEHQP